MGGVESRLYIDDTIVNRDREAIVRSVDYQGYSEGT